MDVIIQGGTVVSCDAKSRVVPADVVISGGRIGEIRPRRSGSRVGPSQTTRVLDARGCAVIPGLVQAHVHLCQALLRGMADDLPLLEWLKQRIWPLEAAHDDRTLTASAELGLCEMMLAGTTTILDMGTVHGHSAVMEACARSGIRAISGKAMMDIGRGVPKALRETTRASLDESDALFKAWHKKDNGRIRYAYAPRFLLSCSEDLVRGAAERARANDVLIHTHAAEHESERKAVKAALGADDVAMLRKWGVYGKNAILAHGVQLTDREARRIAEDKTRIVHCPSANLKLGSGIARIATLDSLGVQLAIGCDGAPCNNNLDPWQEMRHAALLAKVRTGPTSLPAQRVLELATIEGARALGIDDFVGSIEVGKRADITVVRIDDVHAEPGGDVYSKLVYACQARDVRHVTVDGHVLVQNGVHTRFDTERVAAQAREWGRTLSARAMG